MLDAIKQGKAQDILLEELDKVQATQKDLEREIARENSKFPLMTVDKVKFFMERFVKGDVNDFFFRERLIDTFINKITIYNDKIAILFNIQDSYSANKICIYYSLADQTVPNTNIFCFPFGFASVFYFNGLHGSKENDADLINHLLWS